MTTGSALAPPSSAKKLFKIKLSSGRVLGPLDLERISLFISKETITGTETAKAYPNGEWKDINHHPEIAELFIKKLKGELVLVQENAKTKKQTEISNQPESGDFLETQNEESVEPKIISSTKVKIEKPTPTRDDEGTMVLTRDTEGTQVLLRDESELDLKKEEPTKLPADESEEMGVQYTSLEDLDLSRPSRKEAVEKTVFLKAPPKEQPKKKSIISPKMMAPIAILALIYMVSDLFNTDNKKKPEVEIPFVVALPVVDKTKTDPQQSEIHYKAALSYYNLDSVDGYKKASGYFAKAIVANGANVKAIALLASCYLNLVDNIGKDERFFQVVTGLIEAARAKQVDLAEVVIAEVELFNVLSNPDAAIQRLVDHTKTIINAGSKIPVELFYYLALSYFNKGQLTEAIQNLDLVPQDNWFSARVPYLYGLIFEKNNQLDQAVSAFEKAIQKSKNHIKSRSHLAEVFLKKDDLPSAAKQADYVITNSSLSSEKDLNRARYIRARLRSSAGRYNEALEDLSLALKSDQENIDLLFEYYTIKARVTKASPGDNTKMAKVFDLLAQGEDAMTKGDLDTALRAFLEARKTDDQSPQPLMRIAEIFKRRGDFYNSMQNYKKAVQLAPTREDLYPPYIRLAIESYEFEESQKAIEKYTALNPPPPAHKIDFLYGLLHFKKENYKDALLFFKRSLQSATADVVSYVYFADILFKMEQFKDAAFYYGIARRYDPGNSATVIGIAKCISEIEGQDKAIKFITDEIERAISKAPLYVGMAEIYLKKNNSDAAMKAVDSALSIDPKYNKAIKVRGDIFQSIEKYKEAEDAYSSYLAVSNNDPEARIEKYKIAMKKPDFVAARKEILQLLNQYPKYPGGQYMLGDVALRAQNYKEAFAMAEVELKNNPSYIPAMILSGNALNMAGEYLKALEKFNLALSLNPNYVPALIGAGYANHKIKGYAAAQTLLERAVKLDTGDPLIRKRLGSLYFDMGMRKEATQQLKVYLDLSPAAPDRAEVEQMIR